MKKDKTSNTDLQRAIEKKMVKPPAIIAIMIIALTLTVGPLYTMDKNREAVLAGEKQAPSSLLTKLTTSSGQPDTAVRKEKTDAECMQDFNCWWSRHVSSADITARILVELQYGKAVSWVKRSNRMIFDGGDWADKKKGTMWYSGSSLMIQDRYGRKRAHFIKCIYDPKSGDMYNISVKPARG